MSWNYRVVRFKGENEEDTYYELKEVFYNRDGSLMGYADATVSGESFDDIIKVLAMMKEDAHKSVIDEAEFFKGGKDVLL
jgi:hypothetical protein